MRLIEQFSFRFAKAHRTPIGALHLTRQEKPRGHHDNQRQPIDQERQIPRHSFARRLGGEVHTLLRQAGNKTRIIRRIGLERPTIGQGTGDIRTRYRNAGNAAAINIRKELAIAHVLRGTARARTLEKRH